MASFRRIPEGNGEKGNRGRKKTKKSRDPTRIFSCGLLFMPMAECRSSFNTKRKELNTAIKSTNIKQLRKTKNRKEELWCTR
jgi:hypothetical protein